MHQAFWCASPADLLQPNDDSAFNPFGANMSGPPAFGFNAAWQPIIRDGVIRNFKVKLFVAPGVGQTRSFTVHTNNLGATGLAVTIGGTDTEGEDSSTDVSVEDGDFVWVEHVGSTTAAETAAVSVIEFDIDDNTSMYSFGGFSGNQLGFFSTFYDGALYGGQWTTSSDERSSSIVMIPGSVTKYGVHLTQAPGAGRARTFHILKNGVVQDGTGGTVDTTLAFSDSDTLLTATFDLPVLALDRLRIREVPTNTPNPLAFAHGCLIFASDNAGQFQVGAAPDDFVDTDITEFNFPVGRAGIQWNPSESIRYHIGPINPIILSALTTRVVSAPSLGDSVSFTLRKNGVDTDITTTIPTGSLTAGVDGSDVEIASGDTFSFKGVSNGTSSPQITYWAYVGSDAAFVEESPEDSPEESPTEPPDREPPSSSTPSPDECPCPPPRGNPPIDGGQPPDGPGNPGTTPGGEGWTPGAGVCDALDGTVNSYTTATPPESMEDVRDVNIWVRLGWVSFDAEDVETFDPQDIALDATMPDAHHETYGGRKDGKLFTISPIVRGMSDDNGNFVGQRVTLQTNDKTRNILRTRLGTSGGKYVWEREVDIYAASEANRRSGYTLANPRDIHRGLTYDIALGAGFTAAISSEDRLCSQFGAFGPDRSFSTRLLTLGMLPGLPRDLVGKPQQWIFGEVSDEGAVDIVTGEPAAKGLVRLWLVGTLGSEDEYHLAAHDIGGMILYGSDGATPPKRVALTEGVDYRWETLDLVDSETGLTHRVTHVYLPTGSVPTEAHKTGGVSLAANVCGKLGTNGQTITDLFKIYQAVFELIVLPNQEYHTGPYPDGPLWGDGRAMIHSESFEDAQGFSIDRIGGEGYKGGFVLGGPGNGPVTLRELLRRMSNSGDCWFTWTAAGQLKVVLLDDTADVESAPILREPARLRALPTPSYAFDEVENPVIYAYDWDDDAQKFRVPQLRVRNESALVRMGRERPSPRPIEMRCVRDHMTARDVASRRLLRRQYPPAYFPVVEPIDGLDRDPGDIIRVTSIEGPGNGCVERPLFIKEQSFDPNTRRVTHICRDLTDIIAGFGEWASDSVVDWESASADERETLVFWANDDDLIPTGTSPETFVAGQEWR